MPYTALVQPGGWPAASALNPVNFEALIRRIGSGVNGDTGGSYAPANYIQIHGQGLAIESAPKLAQSYLRTITISGLEAAFDYTDGSLGATNPTYIEPETSSLFVVDGPFDTTELHAAIPLTRLSDGCTLTQIAAHWSFPPLPVSLPDEVIAYPSLEVYRMDVRTGVSVLLGPVVTFATPANPTDYFGGGAVHELVFVPDIDKSLIDFSNYIYFAIFNDVPPTGLNSAFLSDLACSSIVENQGFQ